MEILIPFRIGGKSYSNEDLDELSQVELRELLLKAEQELFDVESFLEIDDLRDPEKTQKRKKFRIIVKSFIALIKNKIQEDDEFYLKFYDAACAILPLSLLQDLEEAADERNAISEGGD